MDKKQCPLCVSRYKTKWGLIAECWEIAPGSLETGFEFRYFENKLGTGERKIYEQLRRIDAPKGNYCRNLGIIDKVTNDALYLLVVNGRAFLSLGETLPIEPDLAECIASQTDNGINRLLSAVQKAASNNK